MFVTKYKLEHPSEIVIDQTSVSEDTKETVQNMLDNHTDVTTSNNENNDHKDHDNDFNVDQEDNTQPSSVFYGYKSDDEVQVYLNQMNIPFKLDKVHDQSYITIDTEGVNKQLYSSLNDPNYKKIGSINGRGRAAYYTVPKPLCPIIKVVDNSVSIFYDTFTDIIVTEDNLSQTDKNRIRDGNDQEAYLILYEADKVMHWPIMYTVKKKDQ